MEVFCALYDLLWGVIRRSVYILGLWVGYILGLWVGVWLWLFISNISNIYNFQTVVINKYVIILATNYDNTNHCYF